jgi:poly(beta-D-mannuronate) lyase
MIADSLVINNNSFINNSCNFFSMNEEREDKGYYNAEKIFIGHNYFSSQTGTLLNIYRGGSDESTLGPDLTFSHNKLSNCSSIDPLITLTGIQVTNLFSNNFSNCNPSLPLILYKDLVRARHNFERNTLTNSGKIEKNVFVTEKSNTIR